MREDMERAGGCFAIGDDGIIRELCRSNRLESKELGEREGEDGGS
jgi:hypothetical protein